MKLDGHPIYGPCGSSGAHNARSAVKVKTGRGSLRDWALPDHHRLSKSIGSSSSATSLNILNSCAPRAQAERLCVVGSGLGKAKADYRFQLPNSLARKSRLAVIITAAGRASNTVHVTIK